MNREEVFKEYYRWVEKTKDDLDSQKDLLSIEKDENEIIESFYKPLNFGTSGIRGILAIGTNRINKYVIKRTNDGLGNYLRENIEKPKVVIAYDSRKYSKEFANLTAKILSGKGIEVCLFKELTPVSVLSFSIPRLKADMGIMITASHNPAHFNGYKVYNSKGYQVVGKVAQEIFNHIEKVDYFDEIPMTEDNIKFLDSNIKDAFIEKVVSIINSIKKEEDWNIKVVYSPLNGTGASYLGNIMKKLGCSNFKFVPVQKYPDENFTTCKVPNPEKISAYTESFSHLDRTNSDIVILTDPDSDRLGVGLYDKNTKVHLSGNAIAILIFDFLCKFKDKSSSSLLIKSIVSTPVVDVIAKKHNIRTKTTLTGFKYIGEEIDKLSAENKKDYFFGFEESNGFLIDPFILDKDGLSSAALVILIANYYKNKGLTLIDRLEEIYEIPGLLRDRTENYIFEGIEGVKTMSNIMEYFRNLDEEEKNFYEIIDCVDYSKGIDDLAKADVLKFNFKCGSIGIIRPSGTEPKLKLYLFLSNNMCKGLERFKSYISSKLN